MARSGVRRTPYTERGIRRVPCFRCGKPSHQSWQVCADGNQFRAVCRSCDVGLNRLVLRWLRDPDADEKLRRYQERLA